MKLLIILIITLLISLTQSHKTNDNLFSVTVNEKGRHDIIAIVYSTTTNKIVYNTTLDNLYNLIVQGIQSVNRVGSTMTLFCTNFENTQAFLFEFNVNDGYVYNQFGSVANQYKVINNNAIHQGYLYHGDQVYLPATVDGVEGLTLLVWNFDDTPSKISTFGLRTLTEVEVNPIGAIDTTNKLLYIAYQARGSNYTSIASLPLIGYAGSSSDNVDYDRYERDEFTVDPVVNGLVPRDISLLYCDEIGNVYAVQSLDSGVTVCKLDLVNGVCNNTYKSELPLNPNMFSYNPIFINQDKTSVITLLSKQDNFETLILSVENTNTPWSYSNSTEISNYYTSETGTFEYTYFAY